MTRSGNSLNNPKRAVQFSSDSERSIVHSWQCSESVTALTHSCGLIFAGTDRGTIRAFDVASYAFIGEFKAHDCSILVLESRGDLLYSGSSDSLVKTWDISPKHRSSQIPTQYAPELLYTIYSTFDIGEVFCIEPLPCGMLYMGAQNASISWIDPVRTRKNSEAQTEVIHCEESDNSSLLNGPLHPAVRPNKFFDSAGPGGRLAPPQHRSKSNAHIYDSDETLISIAPENRLNFAHNGFVYCIRSFYAENTTTGEKDLRLASGSSDGLIKIWAVSKFDMSLTLLHTISPDGGAVLSMAIANSWEMYCGLESGVALTIDLETYQTVSYDVSKGKPLLSLIASNDLFICSSDSTIFECNARSISGNSWLVDDEITAQSFLSSNDQRIMTSTRSGTVHLWETAVIPRLESSEDAGATANAPSLGLNDDAMISALGKLVSLETVSSRDGAHWYDGRECATLIKDMCSSFGASSHLLKVDNGNPIVYASFKANKPETTKPARVLFYGHYDVIETSNIWKTNPYTLTPEDGYLYGRGASDNKGPCVAAIFAVAELVASKRLACDVVFVIEGEEESGSFGFEQVIEFHKDTIGAIDYILFSNSYWIDDTHPCLNYGLRGIVSAEITINSDEHDAHSGVVGGVYREPAFDLIHLLGYMTSGQGEITIPGFWDNVLPVSEHEKELYAEIQNLGPSSRMKDILASWRFPSLTVHSMNVSGPGNKTVIPSKVTAATSIRIVPNQTAEEIIGKLTAHLKSSFELLKSPNHLRVNIKYTAEPWMGDPTNNIFEILKKAVRREWDVDPLFVREGGSIPMARRLEQIFGAQAAHLPIGQSSDNAHLDNERLRVRNFIGARRILRHVFEELA